MAEIYGQETGLCKGYGGSMHLDRRRARLPRHVGDRRRRASRTRRGAAYAAQIRGKGQVVLGFFGDGASKQGAFHESLNIASLWKLPVVLRDGEQQLQRRHARRAGGRERRRRRAARGEGEGVLDAGRDGRRRRPGRGPRAGLRGGRAGALRRGADARRVARLPAERPREHHRAARRAAPLPGARGDHRLRQRRGVRGGEARRPGAPLPRAARRPTGR